MNARSRAELQTVLGKIVRTEPVAGGDINEARRVELADRTLVFVKSHSAPPPGMYAAEAAGLAWLREGTLRVPRVIAVGDTFLALEWLELGQRDRHSEEKLGRGLAQLHALGAPTFGLDRSNYLATIPQDNMPEADFATFYIERRLRPLIAQLRRIDVTDLDAGLDALARRPERFGPPERPARLHGDLWWGNVAFCDRAPVLIDPAVYGGHREIDLAMLMLFGGVSELLVGAYSEVWPLAPDWRSRVQLWQLYPVAAHAVLFGGGYTRQLSRMLSELTS
ncbi:MAG: fructosamine kinase family protein [Deltaproteobacteria bacterium]|nr:fructosamine kinase family protein [Deltaproteobacteria bacterium]